MRVEQTIRDEMSAAEVYVMLTTKAFQENKCRDAGALSWRVTVADGADGATVTTKRTLPTVGFPRLLRKLLPSGVSATETIVWGPAADDGSRTAELDVDFHGSPAAMIGTISIVPAGPDACDVVVDADFKSHVPVIGGRVEKIARPIIVGVIDAEEATGKSWMAGER